MHTLPAAGVLHPVMGTNLYTRKGAHYESQRNYDDGF
jgi:hypothetical protein